MEIYAQELSGEHTCNVLSLPHTFYIDQWLIPKTRVAIFERPHCFELIEAYKKSGARVIVDYDDDFWAVPRDHPGYKSVGPGNPDSLKRAEVSIRLGDRLTVSTPEMGQRLSWIRADGVVMPNGWSERNLLWSSSQFSSMITIGWVGTITHREDFRPIVQTLTEILKRYPSVRIAIGLDPEIYRYFAHVREEQRIYLPLVPYDLYPYLLGYFDIFIAPLEDNPFNRAKSDIKLVEAGAKGIPWIASKLPMYEAWGAGGIIAANLSDWKKHLVSLIEDEALRQQLGRTGNMYAREREAKMGARRWMQLIEETL